ncbi:unnamed protein product [Vitrella brassicaformis CCMP3155]|uniref:Uncharacterized protein n=1 Tax=Vitrella brassicaformis (strain CCMP3155) TaxID=1169540 RepID=A0A0G4FR66_VITBC|nr:unnamed protein product [Vitrella brassicaformis CCMP3155]|eukprot:CEM16983.1 unnamed protein product [Vitrella brassicaformis CCMP3155]
MASPTRGMHGLARLPSELWVLNLSGTLTDEETMRLSVLDESCFEAICSSTLVIGPAVPRDRRVLLWSQGPQKIILVAAEDEASLEDDVLQFFVTTMQRHGDKIKAIKSVESVFDTLPWWDAAAAGLQGAPRTFPALTDIDVGLLPVLKTFWHLGWKTPKLNTLTARLRSGDEPRLLDRPSDLHQPLTHLLAHSPLIRHIDVFPLPTHVCGSALDTRADSLEAVGGMVFIAHDQEMDRLVRGLPRIQPPATSKRIGIFDRNLAFESTLPASFDPARRRDESGAEVGPTLMQLLVELESRGYWPMAKGLVVTLKGSCAPADSCPAKLEGSIRDIVKRGIREAETVVMSYDEHSRPWDDSWELADSSGRPVVFHKTKYLIIKCVDLLRGYVGHDAIAGWTAGGWTSAEVLTLEKVEYQSVKDHTTNHKHRFTADGIHEKPLPPQLPMTQQEAEDQAAYAAAGVPTPVRPPPPTNHYVLSESLQRLLKTMPPTLHTVRLIRVPWWAAFDAFVCLSEGTAAQQTGEGGTKRVCLGALVIRTRVEDSPLVVPEKGGALWSTMQERLSLDTLVMNVKTEPNTVVLTVNTRQYEVSDDGDDIEPDEAKYPFLKWFTGDVRARYRMCHCGSGGSSCSSTTDGRMDVMLKSHLICHSLHSLTHWSA